MSQMVKLRFIDENNEMLIVLHHLDSDNKIEETFNFLNEESLNIKILTFRNNSNNIEGCSLLKKGYKPKA